MTGLEVTGAPLGLGITAEQEVHSVWDTLEDVMTVAMKEGFFPMNRPNYACPELDPNSLVNATSEQFAVLCAQLESWQSYVSSTLAAIEGAILQADNEMDIISTDIRNAVRQQAQEAKEKKPAEKVIDDMVKANPRYRQLMHEHQQHKQKKLLMDSHLSRLSRSLRILSRFVEVRKLEAAQDGRRQF